MHHRVVGHRQAEQEVGPGRQRSARPRERDHLGTLRARDVDRIEQRRHAADVRDRDHHPARALGGAGHLLQVVVGPGIGRKPEPKQPRLQIVRHEPGRGAGAKQIHMRRCRDGGHGAVEHCHVELVAHARHRGRGAARDLAHHLVGRILDVHAPVQRRAAERQILCQRELELAQAGKAEVAAGAHDGGHRAARAFGQRFEALLRCAVGVLEDQVEDGAPRRRCAGARLGHLLEQRNGHGQKCMATASLTR
jgi:hypothetical protein